MAQSCCQYPHGPKSSDDGVFPAHDRTDDGVRYEIRRVVPADYVEVQIDGIPAPPNQTRRQHWHANAEAAAMWRRSAGMAGLYVKDEASRRFTLPFLAASIEYVFVLEASRGDLDNLIAASKPLIDGLRDAGLIVDDSVAKLPLIVARWERGLRRGVRIRIRPFETGQIGIFE